MTVTENTAEGSHNPHLRPLLIHGFSYEMIYRLAEPKTILPFIFLTAGAPVLLAGMILPMLVVAQTTSRLGAAPFVAAARLRKTYMAFGSLMIAVSLALIGVTSYSGASGHNMSGFTLAVFLLATIIVAFGQGVAGLAYYTVTPELLDKNRRSWLMNTQNILSAAGGIVLALSLHLYLKNINPLDSHLALIWAAAAFAFFTIFAVVPIREPLRAHLEGEKKDPQKESGFSSSLHKIRDNLARTLKHEWFRSFLIFQILFLSVSATLPFYSIHAASLHKHSAGALSIFVVAICAGLIVGSPIMIRLSKRSLRMTMAFSGIMAAIAACLAISLEFFPQFSHYYYYAPVFLLMSLASQGLSVTINVYLGEMAPESEREFFFATSYFVTGLLGIIAATALGFLAHFQDEIIPILLILAANIVGALYVRKLPNENLNQSVNFSPSKPLDRS